MYEVFNRLNTGGINLKPQEIRTSMYHSLFFEMLYRENSKPAWRHILGNAEADLHMKDVEILLRGFAMLIDGSGIPSFFRGPKMQPTVGALVRQISYDES